jgi:hypothetical protein
MNPLFYVAAAIFLTAICVAVHALLTAPDGYEDGRGFHAVTSDDAMETSSPTAETARDRAPPYLSA